MCIFHRDFDYLNPFLESRKRLHLLVFFGPLVLGKPLVKKMRVYIKFCLLWFRIQDISTNALVEMSWILNWIELQWGKVKWMLCGTNMPVSKRGGGVKLKFDWQERTPKSRKLLKNLNINQNVQPICEHANRCYLPCPPSAPLTINIWGGKMDFSGRKYFLQIFPSGSITILFGKQKQTERRSWIWKDRRISYSFDAMTGQWDWKRKYLQIFENIWCHDWSVNR